jgi:hypothetical protein
VRCCTFRKYKSHNKTPPPISCAVNKNIPGWFIHVLAVSAFIAAHYIPGTTFVPHSEPLHFIPLSFHTHTSAPHSFGSPSLSIPQAPLIQSVTTQALSNAFQTVSFIFCDEFAPMDRILLVLIRNGFFFQKDSKDKYNKDFLSIIFTDKKNKKYSKDKAANTNPRFGQ